MPNESINDGSARPRTGSGARWWVRWALDVAGHMLLETTQRYMHLSAAAPREAIRALELGDILETERVAAEKLKKDNES